MHAVGGFAEFALERCCAVLVAGSIVSAMGQAVVALGLVWTWWMRGWTSSNVLWTGTALAGGISC
eukprot:7501131-Alexandrium_andersonii.AAC.1